MPTFGEGVTFPRGILKLPLTAQRAQVVRQAYYGSPEDCAIRGKFCLVVRVQVVSGKVTFDEMLRWSVSASGDTGPGRYLTSTSVGYSDVYASYGYWVFEVDTDSSVFEIQLFKVLVISRNSPSPIYGVITLS